MQIKSIVVGAVFGLIAGVGSVSANENDVDGTEVNTGTLFALPAGVATSMSKAELDAVRGEGLAFEATGLPFYRVTTINSTSSSSSSGEWILFFDGAAIGH
jgi:hypothetical protein